LEALQKQLLAAVAHELRNPLTPIIGFARILHRRGEYDDELVEDILHHASILQALLDELLETTRVDAGRVRLRRTMVDLAGLTAEAVRQSQQLHPEYRLNVEVPPQAVQGRWDKQRLEQVIANLLSNAVKYSSPGSRILVSMDADEEEARVRVRDEGLGIPSEQVPNLFQRFYRTPEAQEKSVKGFGLGLYVSRGLVEAHGGRMWATSEGAGLGSTFGFAVPFAALEE
jgi:signal transduction histidine kinase